VPVAGVPSWGLGDVAISFGIWIGVQVIFSVIAVGAGVRQDDLENPSLGLTLVMMAVTWTGWLIWPLVAMRWKGTGRPDHDFGLAVRPIDAAWAAAGYAAFWVFSAAATLVFHLVADGEPPTNTGLVAEAKSSTLGFLLLFVAAGLITPVVEELWFRGFFLRALGKRAGVPVAVVVSSVAFGALHFPFTGIGGLWIVGMLTVYGAILALLAVRTRRLGAPIICHAVNNCLAVVTFVYWSESLDWVQRAT
jgi:membrane protease YdiL (CAAX protease family)